MYVCICNAVTEDDVRGCVTTGACSTREVKAACGWKPGCGMCTKRLCEAVTSAQVAVTLATAVPLAEIATTEVPQMPPAA